MEILSPDAEWTAALLTAPAIELKLLDDAVDQGVVEGYGATFGNVDALGDTIERGAFSQTLAEHHAAGSSPAMLWSHRASEPIGRWTAMGEDDRGLRVRGQLNRETPAGRKAHAHLKAGDVSGLSMGFIAPPGGAERKSGGGRTLKRVDLREVSVVAMPADKMARVVSVKSIVSRADLEDLLRESGLPRPAARKLASGGWPALSGEAGDEEYEQTFASIARALDRSLTQLKGLKS